MWQPTRQMPYQFFVRLLLFAYDVIRHGLVKFQYTRLITATHDYFGSLVHLSDSVYDLEGNLVVRHTDDDQADPRYMGRAEYFRLGRVSRGGAES